jgi:hypothetical protein
MKNLPSKKFAVKIGIGFVFQGGGLHLNETDASSAAQLDELWKGFKGAVYFRLNARPADSTGQVVGPLDCTSIIATQTAFAFHLQGNYGFVDQARYEIQIICPENIPTQLSRTIQDVSGGYLLTNGAHVCNAVDTGDLTWIPNIKSALILVDGVTWPNAKVATVHAQRTTPKNMYSSVRIESSSPPMTAWCGSPPCTGLVSLTFMMATAY